MLTLGKIDEIIIRIAAIEAQLKIIDEAIAREIEKPFFERKYGTCRLLDIERKVFAARLDELKWMIDE